MGDIILDLVQAGLESVRGTGVAATRKVYATGRDMSVDRTLSAVPDASGTYFGRRRASYSRLTGGLTFTDVVTYEDLPWWLQLALKGGVTGVTDGGTPPGYTYTFTPTAGTDDLKAATFEGIDKSLPYQWKQSMINTWNLRWDSDSDNEPTWMFETSLLTLAPVQQAVTGSIGDRTTETVLARGTKVYLDASGGSYGGTQLTGRAISGSISGNNNLFFRAYAENEDGPAANKVTRGGMDFDGQLVVAFDSNAEVAEFYGSPVVFKKIRLEREGTVIHTTTKKRVRIDAYGAWSAVDWGDRNGERIVSLSWMAFYDSGLSAPLSAAIVNALATLA